MILYQTKENNVINLDRITMIYRDPETNIYRVSFTNGMTYEMPEITEEDIERFMQYNSFINKIQ